MISAPFRFDQVDHVYSDDRGPIPSITQLLDKAGLVDNEWWTDDASARGTAVHRLCAEFDLGAIEPDACVSPYRGYLLAHVSAMKIIRPSWAHIETPAASTRYRFAGTCDRVGLVYGEGAVWEIKSGAPTKAHPIQLAMQAILAADELRLPTDLVARYGCYLSEGGRFKLERFTSRADFVTAYAILKEFC